jgi:hypothetical protein
VKLVAALVVMGLAALASAGAAQEITFDTGHAAHAGRQQVELLDDAIAVDAGKPQDVELRFRVDPGVHINSHEPKDELLLPTTLQFDLLHGLDNARDVRVTNETFPQGQPFHLTVGAGETLSVYAGEFRVGLRLVAARGASVLSGTLRYQACDSASCYPPRTLPVKIAVTGR